MVADRGGRAGVHEVRPRGQDLQRRALITRRSVKARAASSAGCCGRSRTSRAAGRPGSRAGSGRPSSPAWSRRVPQAGGPAGSFRRSQRQAALGRVQGAGGGEGDEPSRHPGRPGCACAQPSLRKRRCRGRRRRPAAARFSSTARRTAAGWGCRRRRGSRGSSGCWANSQLSSMRRVRPGPGPGDRRVAVRPGGELSGACLVGGQPGGLGEARTSGRAAGAAGDRRAASAIR